MSRIGRRPIELPSTVAVSISPGRIQVNGPLGELSQQLPARMLVEQSGEELVVKRPTERGEDRALHGLTRSLVANMVTGVTDGFTRALEINGVGYRAASRGGDVEFALGYSHPVVFSAPEGITLSVEGTNRVVVAGVDNQLVGQVAANIRKLRPPEPYKGKGIKYEGERIRRKAGKAAK